MAYSDNAKKRGRSRRVGSYQQGQERSQPAQPTRGSNKPMFNDMNTEQNPQMQQTPNSQSNVKPPVNQGGSMLINEDTSEGTFKTEMSQCVWKGIINGESFKDAKKKCNG